MKHVQTIGKIMLLFILYTLAYSSTYAQNYLIQDKVISTPAIFKDEKAHKNQLNEVLFFIEGELMQ